MKSFIFYCLPFLILSFSSYNIIKGIIQLEIREQLVFRKLSLHFINVIYLVFQLIYRN
jgi:hypothetical protein